VGVHRGSDICLYHFFDFGQIKDFHQNGYIHPRTINTKQIYFTIKSGYLMTTQTKNSTENTKNARKYKCRLGMEQHHNHNGATSQP
jgi:hypothetical protein